MDGIEIKLDYIKERSRYKSLFAPFALLPILILLYLWTGQSNIVNFMEYKIIHSYDSSFNAQLSSLDKSAQDSLATLKKATDMPHSALEVKKGMANYVKIFFSCMSSAFTLWSLLFLSIYTFLYSLLLFIPIVAFLLFTGKYPSWLYNWNREALGYFVRVVSYFLLLSPNFPQIEGDKDIIVTIPEVKEASLSNWKPLIKWFLAIPHFLILMLLFCAVLCIGFFSYFYTIIAGKYPQFAFDFILKYLRWNLRVICYTHILVTDKYPSFSFK